MHSALIVALAVTVAVRPSAAFWRMGSSPVVIERLDPIVFPGKISPHLHVFHGANAVQASYNQANQDSSTCTTVDPQGDLSSYWYPALYYQWPNGSFSHIDGYANIYYLPRNKPNETIIPFPKGLQMLAGSPLRRTYNASNVNDAAVSYVCLDYAGNHDGDAAWKERHDFFSHNCPNGMRSQVMFPACWDGIRLNTTDNSHVAYPIGNHENGFCPRTHPKRFMTLFYEAVFNVQKFPYRAGGWVFSFGDSTGNGFHGDFISGWDINLLSQAIKQCNVDNGGTIDECAPLKANANKAKAQACKPSKPVLKEDYGAIKSITAMPGDNPVWVGTGPKPSCNCVRPEPTYVNPNSTLAAGFKTVGVSEVTELCLKVGLMLRCLQCISEPNSGRALTGASYVNTTAMTGGLCSTYCSSKGFK
ncbi:hypothetical protein EMMF5_001799 [Cystobasidiomycetes sp. EMM_F5]